MRKIKSSQLKAYVKSKFLKLLNAKKLFDFASHKILKSGSIFEEMEDIAPTENVLQSTDSSRFVSHKGKMSQKFNSRKDS